MLIFVPWWQRMYYSLAILRVEEHMEVSYMVGKNIKHGTTTLENSLVVSLKVKWKPSRWNSYTAPRLKYVLIKYCTQMFIATSFMKPQNGNNANVYKQING